MTLKAASYEPSSREVANCRTGFRTVATRNAADKISPAIFLAYLEHRDRPRRTVSPGEFGVSTKELPRGDFLALHRHDPKSWNIRESLQDVPSRNNLAEELNQAARNERLVGTRRLRRGVVKFSPETSAIFTTHRRLMPVARTLPTR